ncbi:NAD-dependent epimerase/dehydratase family protein, partial [Streptomyces scabiei]
MRILVTGAQGFVGGYLLTHLRERGDEVTPTCEPGSLAPGYL